MFSILVLARHKDMYQEQLKVDSAEKGENSFVLPDAVDPDSLPRQILKNLNKLLRYDINGIQVWYQLTWIKYKVSSDKVLQIEPKEDLKKRTGKSPDFAESLMLTFADGEAEPEIFVI